MPSSGPSSPKVICKPSYDSTHTIWTVPVDLKPDWSYVFVLNAEQHHGFQSREGAPLPPVTVNFKTRAVRLAPN